MTQAKATPIVLTIAGSDSGGGAGIQADIKSISANGGYACSVITAITAQNTLGVDDVFAIPAAQVALQLDAVFSDLNIVAVKIGMLADAEIIDVVADKLEQYQPQYVVLDPVMVATSGDSLIVESAVQQLIKRLFPLATVVTPNLPEAAKIAASEVPNNNAAMDKLAREILTLGPKAVLMKGGHLDGEQSHDLLISASSKLELHAKRIDTQNTHGTGCTLSSAIATYLAKGQLLEEACLSAKEYITNAIAHADELEVGQGHGPVHHFYRY